jgi:DNA-directed RNA polymerase specialized sigma24 family protein
MIDEGYVRFLGSFFFASGWEREDIEQEARLAILRAPEVHSRIAARRQVLDVVKVANRRRLYALPVDEDGDEHDEPDSYDLVEHVLLREELRTVIAAAHTRKERVALGRLIRGESTSRPKWVDNALVRVRRRGRVA